MVARNKELESRVYISFDEENSQGGNATKTEWQHTEA